MFLSREYGARAPDAAALRLAAQCCEITRSMIPYSFASSELMK
jgi:hypothetical protein